MKNYSEPQELTIIPLVGIDIFTFGMKRKSVHEILGQPEIYSTADQESFWNGQLSISYKNDEIRYIGVRNLGSLKHKILLFGKEIFYTPVETLLESISDQTKLNWLKTYNEIPYAYIFPELGIYLWREYLPEGFEDREFYSNFEYIGFGDSETE